MQVKCKKNRTFPISFNKKKKERKKGTAAIISIKFKTKLASQWLTCTTKTPPTRDISRIIYLRVKHKTWERGRDIPASANTKAVE